MYFLVWEQPMALFLALENDVVVLCCVHVESVKHAH